MFLFLLFIALIILGLIFFPKILRQRYQSETEEITEHFQLSPLEASVLRDLAGENPSSPRPDLLYLLCLKPIRPEMRREIARTIMDTFPDGSEAQFNLRKFARAATGSEAGSAPPSRQQRETALETLDQMNRDANRARWIARNYQASLSPQRPPVLQRPIVATAATAPPDPRVVNPFEHMLEDDFDVFTYIGDREFLQQITAFREFEERLPRRRARHVYENQQNVHALNAECLTKAYKLVAKYKARATYSEIEKEISLLLLNAPVGKTEAISATLERVREDHSAFGYPPQTFTLSQLFYAVVMYIKLEADEEVQMELQKRLYEELEEASKQCGTGHIVRFLNVLQGFDTEYAMQLSVADEVYARLSILAQKEIEQNEAMDEILADNDMLVQFLRGKQARLTSALVAEYTEIAAASEIEAHVKDALNKYTKSSVF